MDIKNLDKLPATTRETLKLFLTELHGIYGEEITAIFAYGSVTGFDYNPKTSDINIAVVLKEVFLDGLKRSLKTVKRGLRKKITAPLFLTQEYIDMSLDTFPIEFMDIKDSRCLLFGEDILEAVSASKEDLRRECESQLKGKLLMIRQAYLEQALSRKGLERLIKASFGALMPVFRNMLRIKTDSTPPAAKEDMLRKFGEAFDIDVSSFLEVLRDKKSDGRIGDRAADTFLNDFLAQLDHLSKIIDRL